MWNDQPGRDRDSDRTHPAGSSSAFCAFWSSFIDSRRLANAASFFCFISAFLLASADWATRAGVAAEQDADKQMILKANT